MPVHVLPDRVLDRTYQLDWRSLNHTVGKALLSADAPVYRPRSMTWSVYDLLDQDDTEGCVGFTFAHELMARPQVIKGIGFDFAHDEVYHPAQHTDWWQGCYLGSDCPIQPSSEKYGGTSVLAAAQILTRAGYYNAYRWALSIEELAIGLMYHGPCAFGSNWYTGMFWPDAKGFLHPIGNIEGGHGYLLHAIKIVYKTKVVWKERTWSDVDLDKSYVTVWNSWGRGWGINGKAKISLRDLERLLHEQGDACFPDRNYEQRTLLIAA